MKPNHIEFCPNCGSLLTFVGMTNKRDGAHRVLTCLRSLTHREPGKTEATMVPCNPGEKVVYRGRWVDKQNVPWQPRPTDKWLSA